MTQKVLIPSAFVEPLISYLSERNLKSAELEGELRELKSSTSMCAIRFGELMGEIQKLDPVPGLGFRLGMATQPRNFGVMGYLFLSCNNLGQALGRYGSFRTLVQTGLKSWTVEEGGNTQIYWKRPEANARLSHEFSIAAFVRLYQTLIGKDIPPVCVAIPGPAPNDTSFHEAIMGCPIKYEAQALMVEIPLHLLSMRISSSDPYLRKLLEQQAQALMQQSSVVEEDFAGFFEKMQSYMIKAMKDGDVSAEVVARKMGYSLRSFYRKLSAGGHSYRSILSEMRLRLAKQYMADKGLSHSEIALLLGYSEQSSFIRAFRHWTGVTPGEYRERLHARKNK
ncbi:MAG: AraC family transcriptional regulator ligand-binding domain-containing protein [Methyloligellaceae bacterium]